MKPLLFFLAFSLYGQTCSHTVTRTPVGPVQVWQNGLLLTQGAGPSGYTYTVPAKGLPIISPNTFSVGDSLTTVFPRQVTLTVTGLPAKVPEYATWQEQWVCTQGNATPLPPPINPTNVIGALTAQFLGGAPNLSCQYLHDAAQVNSLVLTSVPASSATVDIQVAPFAAGFAGAVSIAGTGTIPSIVNATQAMPSLTGFNTLIPANSWVCFSLSNSQINTVVSAWLEIISQSIVPAGPVCDSGVVNASDIAVPFNIVESAPAALAQLPGSTLYTEVLVSETTRFVSPSATALTVSIGRPGTNNSELTGTNVPLMVSGGDANFWPVGSPPPPTINSPYDLVIAFKSTGDLLNTFTSGALTWKICHYPGIPSSPASASRLASLQTCNGGGGTIPNAWDCTGLYAASIVQPNGTVLNIVGPAMATPTPGFPSAWSPVQ